MKRLLRRRPSPALVIACTALFIALAPAAYGTHLGALLLGHPNTVNNAATSLTGSNAGKMLQVTNNGTGTGATALGLNVAAGKPPLTVNSVTKVANLNADRLDGLDSTAFQRTTQPATNVVCGGCVGTGDVADGAITESKVQPGNWHYIGDPGEPAFQNGWQNYDANPSHVDATFQHAAYHRDVNGVIHLAGLVKNGTVGAPIFTLSGTNCPWFYHALPVIANQALARLTVQFVTPTCGVWTETGSNVWVSLSGVSFRSYVNDDSLSPAALQTLKATGEFEGRRIR